MLLFAILDIGNVQYWFMFQTTFSNYVVAHNYQIGILWIMTAVHEVSLLNVTMTLTIETTFNTTVITTTVHTNNLYNETLLLDGKKITHNIISTLVTHVGMCALLHTSLQTELGIAHWSAQ